MSGAGIVLSSAFVKRDSALRPISRRTAKASGRRYASVLERDSGELDEDEDLFGEAEQMALAPDQQRLVDALNASLGGRIDAVREEVVGVGRRVQVVEQRQEQQELT